MPIGIWLKLVLGISGFWAPQLHPPETAVLSGCIGGVGGWNWGMGGIWGGGDVKRLLHLQSVFMQGGAGICGLQKQLHRVLLL